MVNKDYQYSVLLCVLSLFSLKTELYSIDVQFSAIRKRVFNHFGPYTTQYRANNVNCL